MSLDEKHPGMPEPITSVQMHLSDMNIYCVYLTARDHFDLFSDDLTLARKRFFENEMKTVRVNHASVFQGYAGKVKGKLSKKTLHWKKTCGKTPLQSAFDTGDGRMILDRNFDHVITRKVYFDRAQRWLKSEYFDPSDSFKPQVILQPCKSVHAMERLDFHREANTYYTTQLTPSPYLAESAEQSLLNARFGEPDVVVYATRGAFCYTPDAITKLRNQTLLEIQNGSIILMPAWEIKDGELARDTQEELPPSVSFTNLNEYAKILPPAKTPAAKSPTSPAPQALERPDPLPEPASSPTAPSVPVPTEDPGISTADVLKRVTNKETGSPTVAKTPPPPDSEAPQTSHDPVTAPDALEDEGDTSLPMPAAQEVEAAIVPLQAPPSTAMNDEELHRRTSPDERKKVHGFLKDTKNAAASPSPFQQTPAPTRPMPVPEYEHLPITQIPDRQLLEQQTPVSKSAPPKLYNTSEPGMDLFAPDPPVVQKAPATPAPAVPSPAQPFGPSADTDRVGPKPAADHTPPVEEGLAMSRLVQKKAAKTAEADNILKAAEKMGGKEPVVQPDDDPPVQADPVSVTDEIPKDAVDAALSALSKEKMDTDVLKIIQAASKTGKITAEQPPDSSAVLQDGHVRTVQDNGLTAYEGALKNGKRDGFGSYYYQDGQLCYAGYWQDNMREGLGVSFRRGDNALHVSNWKKNHPGEFATLFDRTGNLKFGGRIVNGKKQGVGFSYNEMEGSVFVGKWVNNEQTGHGSKFDKQGNLLYTGEWQNGKRHGIGISFDQSGDILFSGEWRDNKQYSGILYKKEDDGHAVD